MEMEVIQMEASLFSYQPHLSGDWIFIVVVLTVS